MKQDTKKKRTEEMQKSVDKATKAADQALRRMSTYSQEQLDALHLRAKRAVGRVKTRNVGCGC